MINITDNKNCCGCTACEAICPKDAITMEPDCMGFKYPKVNLNKCIDCHLCEKVCAFHSEYDVTANFDKPFAYGVRHLNIEQVKTSRSGAAFIALSDSVLRSGGIVYGVGFKPGFVVSHIKATTPKERDAMKGSKYVQSDLYGIFRQIKSELKEGQQVLFSGTPCQVAALKSYLGVKLLQNIYLIDIVCHGVPAPVVWDDYIKWLQDKWGTSIREVNFRDKRFGWRVHRESYLTDKGLKFCNSFTRGFTRGLIIRPSCQVCPYANTKRPSDISLADFWGWEKNAPEWNTDDLGLSLVMVNTPKGKELLEQSLTDLDVREFPIENCMQNQLRRPVCLNHRYEEFARIYETLGFVATMRRFNCIGFGYKLYQWASDFKHRILHR